MKKRKTSVFLLSVCLVLLSCGQAATRETVMKPSETTVIETIAESSSAEPEPESESLTFVRVEAGPAYVYGANTEELFRKENETQTPDYTGDLRYIFITSPGYEALKRGLAEYIKTGYDERQQTNEQVLELFRTEEYTESEPLGWYYSFLPCVVRSDEKVFSVAAGSQSDLGGIHPSEVQTAVNFETSTGKKLLLDDVITDVPLFKSIVLQKLEKYPEKVWEGTDEFYEWWRETVEEAFAGDSLKWCYYPEQIVIWFDAYEIAPYSVGPIRVAINYRENPEVFEPNYLGNINASEQTQPEQAEISSFVSDLFREIVIPMTDRLGSAGYEEVLAFVEKSGFEFTALLPDDGETDGEIMLTQKGSEDHMYLFFWPDESGGVFLSDIWYYHGAYRTIFSNDGQGNATSYRLQDDTLYETICMDSMEDAAATLFLGVE